jgi:uncharacterized protein GlcG (DUF336 family)
MTRIVSRLVSSAHISREASDGLIGAALDAAKLAKFEASIAVVDAGGALRGFARTDGASAMTADAAIGKAWTSATSGYPTHVWNQLVTDPRVMPMTHLPGLLAVSGGLPIFDQGRVVGALGVSGGMGDQDLNVASDALRVAGFSEA